MSNVCACVLGRHVPIKSQAVSPVLERAASIGVQYESYMICHYSSRGVTSSLRALMRAGHWPRLHSCSGTAPKKINVLHGTKR